MSVKSRLAELEKRIAPHDPLDVCGTDLVVNGEFWGTALVSGPRSQLPTEQVVECKTPGQFVESYRSRGCGVRVVRGVYNV